MDSNDAMYTLTDEEIRKIVDIVWEMLIREIRVYQQ